MLTNGKVFDIFQQYLEEDQATEVVLTRHGYAVMLWDYAGQDWSEVTCCQTPEELFDKLLESFVGYQEFLMIQRNNDGEGEVSEEEQEQIQNMCLPYLKKREEAEKV